MIKYLLLGIFVKLITGFDDTIMHIPVLANITKRRLGKVAYSIGMLAAICLAITIAVIFAEILRHFIFYRYISAGLVFLLAIFIYFDVLIHKPRRRAEQKLAKSKKITTERFLHLIGIGFIVSAATVIDDIIAYTPLFLSSFYFSAFAIAGIIIATLLEILIVIYLSKKIYHFRYKKEVATFGLLVLGVLILSGII